MASSSELEKLERRYAENPDGRFFAPLADAYRKVGQLDRALELVRAGLNKHPDYLSAHIVLGRCFLDKGSDADAAATFQSVLGMDGENVIALKSLAEIAERGGRVDEAKDWLQKLLVVDSMNAEAEADLQRLGGSVQAPAAAAVEAPVEAAPETSFADVAAEMAPAKAEGFEPTAQAASEPPAPEARAPEPTTEVVPAVQAAAPEPKRSTTPELEPMELETVADLEPIIEAPPPAGRAIAEMETVPMEGLEIEVPEAPAPAAPPPAKPDVHPLPSETRVSSEALDVMPFDDSLAWGTGERSSRAIRAEDLREAEKTHDSNVTSPAIEFISGIPGAELPPPTPAAVAPAPSLEEFSIEPPPDQNLGGLETPVEAGNVELPANLSGAYSIVDEVGVPPQPIVEAPVLADLPLIMPEDVTPPEELKRPSAKMVQSVSPAPREEPTAHPPMATETMGDLYLKQGLRAEAAEVYRRLLAQRPGDAGLAAKLRAAEGPPPDLRAAALGAESVGTWLKRVAHSRLSAAPAPPPPPAPPPETPTPLESAFASEQDAGEPAHPAQNAFSLDQIFGAPGGGKPAAGSAPSGSAPSSPPAPPAPPALGASFDEFFGSGPSGPASPASPPPRPSQLGEEDLTAFSAWLQGLKK